MLSPCCLCNLRNAYMQEQSSQKIRLGKHVSAATNIYEITRGRGLISLWLYKENNKLRN
jgi:hypothetical protein